MTMKSPVLRKVHPASCAVLGTVWAAACVFFCAAPMFAACGCHDLARLSYGIFAPICHQDPSRSFAMFGLSLAVCQRCSGIYSGLLALSLVPLEAAFLMDEPLRRRIWAMLGIAPILLDALLPWMGIWRSSPGTRFATGFMFGAVVSSLLVPAVSELILRAKRVHRMCHAAVPGGIS